MNTSTYTHRPTNFQAFVSFHQYTQRNHKTQPEHHIERPSHKIICIATAVVATGWRTHQASISKAPQRRARCIILNASSTWPINLKKERKHASKQCVIRDCIFAPGIRLTNVPLPQHLIDVRPEPVHKDQRTYSAMVLVGSDRITQNISNPTRLMERNILFRHP